jgi:diaminopimelate epimerase
MRIPFWKMHGAGNDFVLVDDRSLSFPSKDPRFLQGIAERRFGVGSDGIILIQPSESAHFRMRFFNPDGGEVEMCGNGARCVARLAAEIGAAPRQMKFDTVAGVIRADVNTEGRVRLVMTEPKGWAFNQTLEIAGQKLTYHFVNSGVPHAVVEVPDVAKTDVAGLGRAIRYHPQFQPAGTNANFITLTGPDSLTVRTYERGVEAETLACGTGITACGLMMGKLGKVKTPVHITCASGDVLDVDFTPTNDGATQVTLTGPAAHVFEGQLDYNPA